MRKIICTSAMLILLGGCNTVDGFGKDLGAVGQSFASLFDGSVQNSRTIRDNNDYIMGGGRPAAPMGGGGGSYGGAMGGGMPPMGGGNMGGGYGGAMGGGNMGAMPPQYPPYYQQQPRQPSMPYYYNEGY